MPTRRKSAFSFSTLIQVTGLLLAIIGVTFVYEIIIRPNANEIIAYQEENPEEEQPFSMWIALKDYEQQFCFILFFWALTIIGTKFYSMSREYEMLKEDIIDLEEDEKILPEDVRDYLRKIDRLPAVEQECLLPRVLYRSLSRFSTAKSLDEVSNAVSNTCEAEMVRLDSELSMVRYIAWAIPSIGFIGTVRGIGAALGKAQVALEGDISAVTSNLGTAFNSTLIALLISIVLMFVVHQLQSQQEGLVIEVERYAQNSLVGRLHFPMDYA